jgi:hypothetical protein
MQMWLKYVHLNRQSLPTRRYAQSGEQPPWQSRRIGNSAPWGVAAGTRHVHSKSLDYFSGVHRSATKFRAMSWHEWTRQFSYRAQGSTENRICTTIIEQLSLLTSEIRFNFKKIFRFPMILQKQPRNTKSLTETGQEIICSFRYFIVLNANAG